MDILMDNESLGNDMSEQTQQKNKVKMAKCGVVCLLLGVQVQAFCALNSQEPYKHEICFPAFFCCSGCLSQRELNNKKKLEKNFMHCGR